MQGLPRTLTLGAFSLLLLGGWDLPVLHAAGAAQPGAAPGVVIASEQLARYEGFTEPAKQALMGAPLDGVLMQLPVQEGQAVQAGDALAVIDDRVQRVAVEIARLQSESTAAVESAQAAVDLATVEWENQVGLEARGSATEQDVRQALAVKKQAQAELLRAQENVTVAIEQYKLEQAQLEQYTLRAEFPGVVQVIDTAEGSALRLNDPVLLLVNNDSLRAVINLPESLLRDERVVVGQTYRLQRLDKDHAVIEELLGVLENIDDIIDRGSQTIRFTFTIANPGSTEERMPAGFLFRVASLEAVEP